MKFTYILGALFATSLSHAQEVFEYDDYEPIVAEFENTLPVIVFHGIVASCQTSTVQMVVNTIKNATKKAG